MNGPVIVSIQSQLVFGCAGNNAAVPLLQRLGATVYAVPTTLVSNTPHYPTIAGAPIDPAMIEDLLARLLDRVDPAEIDAILTGYIASAGAAAATARFIDRVRACNRSVVVLCDPVMGDVDCGLYVEEDVAGALVSDLVGRADILTPNLFEAQIISKTKERAPSEAAESLLAGRVSIVAVTGIDAADNGYVSTLAADRMASWLVTTPRLGIRPTGTGDIFSAAFLHRWLHVQDLRQTLVSSVETVFTLLERCVASQAKELDPSSVDTRSLFEGERFSARPAQQTALSG